MQNLIISAGVGTLLFLCALLGFRYGLRLGMQTAKGQIPPKLRNPVEAVKRIVEADPEPETFMDSLLRGHANMMAFTGDLSEKGE